MRQSVILLAIVVLCGTVAAIQPGCRSRYEMRMKWAVQDNSASFWQCSRWGNAARVACPTGTLFSAPFQTCVPEKHWEQFPYYAPPTTVNDYADECTEDQNVCVNPCIEEIECNGGQVINGQCVCFTDAVLVDGICVVGPIDIDSCENGEWNAVEERCVCSPGYELVDGVCVEKTGCVGGTWNVNNECVCEEGYELVNGECKVIDNSCENGSWNAEGVCVCNEGYEWINGWCFNSLGVCDGAPDSAYVRGPMDCNAPACTAEEYWANVHMPTRNPRTFWQCANEGNVLERPCAPGTCFSIYHADTVCVHPWEWVNPCN